MKELEKG